MSLQPTTNSPGTDTAAAIAIAITTAAADAETVSVSCPCPICLDELQPSERLYQIPCQSCDYNYCSKCVSKFCDAADDDWGVASDGSRQVKVTVACPQCRARYPIDLSQVVLLRTAYMLGTRLVDSTTDELQLDSNLNASELRYKRDLMSSTTFCTQLQDAQILYEHIYKKKNKNNKTTSQDGDGDDVEQSILQLQEASRVWKKLISTLLPTEITSEEEETDEVSHNHHDVIDGTIGTSRSNESYLSHGSRCSTNTSSSSSSSSSSSPPMVDDTLFHGLDEFMTRDEKVFLTDLLTRNEDKLLAQAAMIMHGMLRLSWSGKHVAMAKQNYQSSKYETQKHIDYITKTKAAYPLPNHLPNYVLIPAFSKSEGYMTATDVLWDGTMDPPQQSRRVFDVVYKHRYVLPERPRTVVSVSSIRGPVGRVGLRKGDRVTHVNDMPWDGTSQQLMEYIYDCKQRHPNEDISLTVNADKETAQFLHVRYNMMRQARQEAAAANANKGSARK